MKLFIWPIILLNGKMLRTPRPLLLIMQGSFCHAASQWETALHCNVVSHWLGAYTEWSLIMRPLISKNGGIHFVANMTLTHWGRVTHICVSKLTIIGSDNGLSPGRRQAIIWNNAGLLLIEPLGTNSSEIAIGIQRKCTWTCRLRNGVHFVSASMS